MQNTNMKAAFIGASPTLLWRVVQWSMCEELWKRMGLQHTTVVWWFMYNKLTDASIQVLCDAKIFGFVY